MASDERRDNDKGEAEGSSYSPEPQGRDSQSGGVYGEPDAPPEVLEMVPTSRRAPFVRAFDSVTQIVAPAANPMVEKFTTSHISDMISHAENERVRENEADKSRRKYQFAYFLVGLIAIIGLVVFFTLTDNRDLIAPIITGALGFLGGLAAGRYTRRN